jgi:selenoprotein W-related protein
VAEPRLAKISIEYCAECGDAGVALRAAGDLLNTLEDRIGALTLIPSWNGVFELVVDGQLVFSKTRLGRHAQPGELIRLVSERLASSSGG